LLLLLGAGAALALLPVLVGPDLWVVWAGYVVVIIAAFLGDMAFNARRGDVALTAAPPGLLYIGDRAHVDVALQGRPRLDVDLRFEVGDNVARPDDVRLRLDEAGTLGYEVPLLAKRRGNAEMLAVWLRWEGPLGLAQRTVRRPLDVAVPVVPNVRAVRDLAINLLTRRELVVGIKSQSYVGDGSEFESLREYAPGFDHRAIDWKSSARHQKLLVREHRAERNHAIVMAFDTGYLMREPLDGVPRLDHAINAALLLSFVCLKGGDRVGMYAFSDRPGAYLAPSGSLQSLSRLQRLTADLDYHLTETNFTYGMTDLSTRLNRRSLVIVFTDFVDTVSAELMIDNMRRMSRRHLVLFVSLRDPVPDRLSKASPQNVDSLHRAVIADEYLQERALVMRRLRRHGVQCIDANPKDVSTRLINRYLEIQRREMV